MLDTCICSSIMREQPETVLKRLEQTVLRRHRIVVSAITYAEMRFGWTGKKASPSHAQLVDAFCSRLDAVLAWDRAAMPPQRSVPYWPPPVRQLDQTMRLSPATLLRPGRYWSLIT